MTKASKSRISAAPFKSGKALAKGKPMKAETEAFFQDSDDAELDWSSVSGDEDCDEDEDFDEDEEFMDEDDDLASLNSEEEEEEEEESIDSEEEGADIEEEEQVALSEGEEESDLLSPDDDEDIQVPSKFGQEQLASSPFLELVSCQPQWKTRGRSRNHGTSPGLAGRIRDPRGWHH
jgi:hypothetical protein